MSDYTLIETSELAKVREALNYAISKIDAWDDCLSDARDIIDTKAKLAGVVAHLVLQENGNYEPMKYRYKTEDKDLYAIKENP